MATPHPITIVDKDQGTSISVVGDTYRVLISGAQTNGSYAVIDMLVPPGGGPGPHSHQAIQEMFYVVEGEVTFEMATGIHKATKGAFVNIPLGGPVHCFKNNSKKMAHLLCTVVPAGLEAFFEEIGQPVANDTFLPPPEMTPERAAHLKQVAEKYGQKLYPPTYFDSTKS